VLEVLEGNMYSRSVTARRNEGSMHSRFITCATLYERTQGALIFAVQVNVGYEPATSTGEVLWSDGGTPEWQKDLLEFRNASYDLVLVPSTSLCK
jgi:hypothetical protein